MQRAGRSSLRGLLASPAIDASNAEITRFYADPDVGRHAVVIWLQVFVIATIAFLWFVGVVRGRLGDHEPKLFGTVFFGASLLLAGVLFVGAALLRRRRRYSSRSADEAPDPGASSLTRAAAATMLSVFAPRIATLVMFSTAGLGRSTGTLPRWLVWLTYLGGVAEFVNVTIARPHDLRLPRMDRLVSVVLLVQRPPHGFELSPSRTSP